MHRANQRGTTRLGFSRTENRCGICHSGAMNGGLQPVRREPSYVASSPQLPETWPDGLDAAVRRIRAAYLEMPGMSLSVQQVQRLCGVERPVCAVALTSLVNSNFLRVNAAGYYVRKSDDVQGEQLSRGFAQSS